VGETTVTMLLEKQKMGDREQRLIFSGLTRGGKVLNFVIRGKEKRCNGDDV